MPGGSGGIVELGPQRDDVVAVRSRHHVLQQATILDCAGHRPVVAVVVEIERRVLPHPAVRRLEADHAGERRRDADGAADVRAGGEARHPGGESGAEPPDEPPGLYSRFHGLRVTPQIRESVIAAQQNSGVAERAWMMPPASMIRWMHAAVRSATTSLRMSEPSVQG